MSAPASEDLREVERLLVVATEQGSAMTVPQIQEEIGQGHGAVAGILQVLREHGKAFEDAPGEWRGPYTDEIAAAAAGEPEPVLVEVGTETPEATHQLGHGAAALPASPLPVRMGTTLAGVEPTVRMTAAIAAAMGPEALGAMVKAGIDEAVKQGIPFRFEVSG